MPQIGLIAGTWRILDGNLSVIVADARGRPWSPGREQVVGVRDLGDAGYALLLQGGTASRPTWSELIVSPSGVVARSAVRLDALGVIGAEGDYGRDLDGDGEVGFALVGDIMATGDGVSAGVVTGGGLGLVLADEDGGPARILPILTTRGASVSLSPSQEVAAVVGTDDGYILILRQQSGSRVTFSEVAVDLAGVQLGRTTTLSAVALEALEVRLDRDLDGDGLVGDRVTDPSSLRVVVGNGDLLLAATQAGSFAIRIADAVEVVVLRQGTRPWSPGAAEIAGIRQLDDGDIAVLIGRGSATVPIYLEQKFTASGVAIGTVTRLTTLQAIELEAAYGQDLDGNGVIGFLVLGTVAEAGGTSLVEAQGGLYGLRVSDGFQLLVQVDGQTWNPPAGHSVRAILERDGGGTCILLEQDSATSPRFLEATADAFGVIGFAVLKTGSAIFSLEVAYGIDLDGDGRVGDAIALRMDASIRSGEGEVAIFSALSGTYHISLDASLVPGDALGGQTTPLRDAAGNPWAPSAFLTAMGAIPIAARVTDGGLAVILQADLGVSSWTYEQHFTDAGVAVGRLLRLTARQVSDRENLYMQDLDGNAKIHLMGEVFEVSASRLETLGAGGTFPTFTGTGRITVTGFSEFDDLGLAAGAGVEVFVSAPEGVVVRIIREFVGGRPPLDEIRLTVFDSLQVAVDDDGTVAGSKIFVGAGTYAGALTIDKAGLSLFGAQSGTAAWSLNAGATVQREGAETIVAGKVTVTADGDDTMIDGFRFTGVAGWDGVNLDVARGAEGVTIANTVVDAYAAVGGYAKSGYVTLDGADVTFVGNKVAAAADFGVFAGRSNDPLADTRGANAVAVDPGAAVEITVQGNWISGAFGGGVGVAPSGATVAILDNYIENVGEGAFGYGADFGQLTFAGNTITDYLRNGIFIPGVGDAPTGAARIYGNTIDGPRPITLDAGVPSATDAVGEPGLLDLPALIAANTLDLDGAVLLSGGSISVFTTIQAAIDAAAAGDAILVGAGVYDEVITVDKAGLTLIGPNAGIAGHAEGRGAEAVIAGTAASDNASLRITAEGVTFDGFTLAKTPRVVNDVQSATPPIEITGAGATLANSVIKSAVYQKASGLTYADNLVTDFGVTRSGYSQNAISADGNGVTRADWTVTGNVFDGLERGLVLASNGAVGTTYEDITVSGNTFMNIPSRGVQVGDNATLKGAFVVTGNTFRGDGDPATTGDIGLAIRSPVSVDPAAVLTIEGNVFEDLEAGFWAGVQSALAGFDPGANTFAGAGVEVLITGTNGADVLAGTSGSDRFVGFAGADAFVFAGPEIGDDVIADFEGANAPGGDLIDLRAHDGIGFDDLTITATNGAAVITAAAFDGSIMVLGVTGLSADDFLFGAA